MRGGQAVLGAVIFLAGLVWFLQGVRVIPGSFMTGSTFWAVTGAVLAIVGASILVHVARRRTPPHRAR